MVTAPIFFGGGQCEHAGSVVGVTVTSPVAENAATRWGVNATYGRDSG
ncbi:hypothetical protein ACFVX3_19915 [Rhodococcus erythropolis]